jgi:hypothetical protein
MIEGTPVVGLFELAFKFVIILPLFITDPFFRSWSPRQFEVARDENGPEIMARTFKQFMIAMIFFGLILAVLVPDVIRLTSPPEFWAGIPIVTVLLCTRTLVAMAQFTQFGVLYAEKTKLISYINISLAVMAIVVGIPMVTLFGLMGAALTGVAVEFMRFVSCYILGQKYYRIPYKWANFFRLLAVAAICYIVVMMISVESLGLELWCERTVSPIFSKMSELFHLDVIKDGKLAKYLTEKSSVFVNLAMKGVTVVPLYAACILALRVVDLKTLRDMLKRAMSYLPGRSR